VRQRFSRHSDEMLLAFAVWLCSLPLVAIVILPLFGLKVAAIAALVLFLILLAVCWGVCGWQAVTSRRR